MPEEGLDDASDAPAGTSTRHLTEDDEYHEYLWGEESPRSFARKAKFDGTKRQRTSRNVIEVQLDSSLDVSSFVPR